jgi:ribonuclease HIII
MPTSYDLDERLKQYWLDGRDESQASAIIQQALSEPPTSAKQARLALQVMAELEPQLSERLQGLIAEFRAYLAQLRLRLTQVDAIGNADTEPTAALFEVLGDVSEGIELTGFDPAKLRQARVGASSRADAAAALLQTLGWERLPEAVAQELQRAIEELREEQRHYQSYGLFVAEQGFLLGLQVKLTTSSVHHCAARVDDAMRKQAEIALREALGSEGADWDVQWPFPYEGESIGLGLYVAALVAKQQLPPDALTSATGRLDVGGHVRGVAGIAAKLEAARESGIRRVVLPEENRAEAEAAPASAELQLVFVDRASGVRAKLLDTASGRAELGYEGSIRLARSLIPLYGLALEDERPIEHGYRLDVTDGATAAVLNIYSGRRGSVVVGGPQGSARQAAEQLFDDHFKSEKPTAQPNKTYRIPPARHAEAKRLLLDLGAAELEVTNDYESWRLRITHGAANATVVLYTSNKCLLQGQSPAYDEAAGAIERALEGLGGVDGEGGGRGDTDGAAARSTRPTVAPPELPDVPHIGTDESGKGDYFGPLVSAAVFVTPQIGAELKALGVRDSKKMTDKSVRTLAPKLKRLLGNGYAITAIGPKRYNQLYAQMRAEGKNLNTLLAWGHARSLEDLLAKGVKPQFAVVDQFADARYIEQKILADTRESGLEIKQFPKAEADIAVAAASVLAREAFLEWLERESARAKLTLPKGASPQVIEAAREIVARYGRERLGDLAKLSFKTTEKVLEA